MTLKGQARTDYMREYMRRRRGATKQARPAEEAGTEALSVLECENERLRAENAELHQQRAQAAAAASKPPPRSLPVTVDDFKFAPFATGRWLGMRISNAACRAVIAGLTQAIADHPEGTGG